MLITLDASLHKPLYLQIRDQIRKRILEGGLNPGDRLEPSRVLARRLGVHRTTVGNAYAELESEGLIEGTVGRGTFISPLAGELRAANRQERRAAHDFIWEGLLEAEAHDDSLGRLMASAFEPGVISFATAHGPDDPTVARLARRALDAALRREGGRLLQYGSSDGYPPLKEYLVGRMRRDGIPVEPDEILITSGCQQALDLVRRALVEPGDVIASENPTYPGVWQIFEGPGVRLVGVPVGAEGLNLEYLEAVLEQNKVKLIFAGPNFQNPTGSTMPLEARKRLIELAGRFQVPIVEDDIYGALRYDGRDLPPLKALDPAGLVIYVNSFSKVGFPGLRVGWIVASRRVIGRLRSAKQRTDLHTNLLGQAILEEFGRRGWLDRLIRQNCRVFERKLALLRAAVARHFPREARLSYPDGGMSCWVNLPQNVDAGDVLVKAHDRGVIFAPARYFYFQNPQHNAFRLCFTSAADEDIERGIQILGEVLQEEIARHSAGKKSAPSRSGMALV
jgi:DNA-binding transcriptional MocR family regulator